MNTTNQLKQLENLIYDFEFNNIGNLKLIRSYVLNLLEEQINLIHESDLNYRRKFIISNILTAVFDNIGRKNTFPLSVCIYLFSELSKPPKDSLERNEKIRTATKDSIKTDVNTLKKLNESDFL